MKKYLMILAALLCAALLCGAALAEGTLPKVIITPLDAQQSVTELQDKQAKVRVSITYEVDGQTEFTSMATVKLQGNLSLTYPKKNYNIQFYQDNTFQAKRNIDLGWGDHNKYCLKANWIDGLQARNIVSSRLVAQMQAQFGDLFADAANRGVTDGYPVEVYMGEEYYGLYTMNIPKEAWTYGVLASKGHLVMGAENQMASSTTFEMEALPIDELDWSIVVGASEEQADVDDAFGKLNRLISFVKDSTDEEFTANFDQYLNLDACLNYLCFVDLSNAVDNLSKNLMLVTYDGQVWYPCLYDMDTTWGLWYNGEGVYTTDNLFPDHYAGGTSLLWHKLLRCFPEQIQERYNALRASVFSEENIMYEFQRFVNSIPQEAYDRDHAKWTDEPGLDYGMEQIRQHVQARSAYVDHQVDRLTGVADGGELPYQLSKPTRFAAGVAVDTGVSLYSGEQGDYTLYLRLKTNPAATEQETVLFNRNDALDGLTVMTAPNAEDHYLVFYAGNNQYEALPDLDADGVMTLAILKQGDTYTFYMENTDEFRTIKDAAITEDVTGSLYLGAIHLDRSEESVEYNYFSGTIYNAEIYEGAQSVEEIGAHLAELANVDVAPAKLIVHGAADTYRVGQQPVFESVTLIMEDGSYMDVTDAVKTAPANLQLTDSVVTVVYIADGFTVGTDLPVTVLPYDDERMLYALDAPVTMNGSSYINTGLSLYAEEQDFTIVLEYKADEALTDGGTLLSCMRGDEAHSGLYVSTAFDGSMDYTALWMGNYQYEALWNDYANDTVLVIIVKEKDRYTMYENSLGMVRVIENAAVPEAFDSSLLVGVSCENDYYYNYFQGQILHCDVYSGALNAYELSNLLNR